MLSHATAIMVGLGNTERAGRSSDLAARLVRAFAGTGRRVGSVHHLLPRCLWAVMAAAHTPALLSVWESFITSGFDVARLGGCIALSLTMLFFGLKIYGVTFLRIRSRPRSWVAMSLVVVLVHLDVLSAHPHASVVPQCLTIVTSLGLASQLPGKMARTCWPATWASSRQLWP